MLCRPAGTQAQCYAGTARALKLRYADTVGLCRNVMQCGILCLQFNAMQKLLGPVLILRNYAMNNSRVAGHHTTQALLALLNHAMQEHSCWRNEGSLNRGLDHCRGLRLGVPFFLIHAHSSKSTRPFEFRTNLGSV
jgi:hypothetical protein